VWDYWGHGEFHLEILVWFALWGIAGTFVALGMAPALRRSAAPWSLANARVWGWLEWVSALGCALVSLLSLVSFVWEGARHLNVRLALAHALGLLGWCAPLVLVGIVAAGAPKVLPQAATDRACHPGPRNRLILGLGVLWLVICACEALSCGLGFRLFPSRMLFPVSLLGLPWGMVLLAMSFGLGLTCVLGAAIQKPGVAHVDAAEQHPAVGIEQPVVPVMWVEEHDGPATRGAPAQAPTQVTPIAIEEIPGPQALPVSAASVARPATEVATWEVYTPSGLRFSAPSLGTIKQAFVNGEIPLESMVCPPGSQHWLPLRDFLG